VDAEIAGAVVQGDTGAAIVRGAAAEPAQGADLAIGQMGEMGAALAVAVHPAVRDQALEHAALHVKAVAADALHGDVVDVPVVDPAVVAGGDDDLDHWLAAGDLRDDRGAATIEPERALNGAVDVDDDRLGDGVGAAGKLG